MNRLLRVEIGIKGNNHAPLSLSSFRKSLKGAIAMAKFYYGGQAVMEGVMMRGRRSAAVAVPAA
jgi:hypothetical protein